LSIVYAVVSILLVILCLGVPAIATVFFFKRFGKAPRSNEDYLLEKIRDLENRIKKLEDEFYE